VKKNNCWDCPKLKATVGGWYCEEHNVFLYEQTSPDDVGHGGNGCENHKPVLIGVDVASEKDFSVQVHIQNNKIIGMKKI